MNEIIVHEPYVLLEQMIFYTALFIGSDIASDIGMYNKNLYDNQYSDAAAYINENLAEMVRIEETESGFSTLQISLFLLFNIFLN